MLATFVIGLREGLEAALIVGIVAAFLRQRGGQQAAQAIRWVWIGVLSALGICLAVGVALQIVSANLPQRQQEGLETVIGAVAVAMVTYMVVWMRRHSRDLKGQLEGVAGSALARGSAKAMVAMAFLAVLREGLETAVFLLAAFNASGNGLTAGLGALLGIGVAVLLGYGIYRGGVRINLSRFFRATGLVLVLVAAGLVMTALHTAHEAGWLDSGQDQLFDISWLVRNGSVQASLITGVLGFQAKPAVIEVIGWLAYLVPVGLYVGWPPGRSVAWRPVTWAAAALASVFAVAAVAVAVAAPASPAPASTYAGTTPVTGSTISSATANGFYASERGPVTGSVTWSTAGAGVVGSAARDGVSVHTLTRRTTRSLTGDPDLPTSVTVDQLRRLNGGRLPIGLSAADTRSRIALSYQETVADQLWRDPRTGRLLDAHRLITVTASADLRSGPLVLDTVRTTTEGPDRASLAGWDASDRRLAATAERSRSWGSDYPTVLGWAAVASLAAALGAAVAGRRGTRGRVAQRSAVARVADTPVGEPALR